MTDSVSCTFAHVRRTRGNSAYIYRVSSYHSVIECFIITSKYFTFPVAMNLVQLSREDRCQPPVQSSKKFCLDLRFRILQLGIFSKKREANGQEELPMCESRILSLILRTFTQIYRQERLYRSIYIHICMCISFMAW